MLLRIAISVLFLCFSSCTHLPDFPVRGEFEGVKTALDRQSCVNIMLIHGIGGFSVGDPDHLIKAIVRQLHLCQNGPGCTREIIDDNKFYGCLIRKDYWDPCSCSNVHIYILDWKNATYEKKRKLHWMDDNVFTSKERVPFISDIKQNVINNGLADTVLYFSDFQPEIEYPFIQSIRWMYEDSQNEPAPQENIVVGFSIGGIVLVKALDTMQASEDELNQEISKKFINEMSALFFLSNSYPLLELAENHPLKKREFHDDKACNGRCETPSLPCVDYTCSWDWEAYALGRVIYERRLTLPGFQIVSINDPNDLFGYNAKGYAVPSEAGPCINAFLNENVRNVKTVYFGYINPMTVHAGYGSNKKVLSMIIYGRKPRYSCPVY